MLKISILSQKRTKKDGAQHAPPLFFNLSKVDYWIKTPSALKILPLVMM